MRVTGFLLLACLAGSAGAQQTFSPYGLSVSESELRFMTGMHSLAVDLELGRGSPVDYARAAEAYRKAAVLGFPFAQDRLARLYETGLGVPQDRVIAHVWYQLAAASGDMMLISNRDRFARLLRPDELSNAEALANTLKRYLPVVQN